MGVFGIFEVIINIQINLIFDVVLNF